MHESSHEVNSFAAIYFVVPCVNYIFKYNYGIIRS